MRKKSPTTDLKYQEIAQFYGYASEFEFYSACYSNLRQMAHLMGVSDTTAGRRIQMAGIKLNGKGGTNHMPALKREDMCVMCGIRPKWKKNVFHCWECHQEANMEIEPGCEAFG